MHHYILLDGKTVQYTIRESTRAKRVSVTMHGNGELVVSLPTRNTHKYAEKFLHEKKNWILKHLEDVEKNDYIFLPSHTKGEYELYKQFAELRVKKKLEEVNSHYNFPVNRVTVKNNVSQWGSCSAKGNLSFTYKLIFLPEYLLTYVVTHELCHLKEFNHGTDFWRLIGETISNPKKVDAELKRYQLR